MARFEDGSTEFVRPGLATGSQSAALCGQQDQLPHSIANFPQYIMENGEEKTRNAIRQLKGETVPLDPRGSAYARIGKHCEDLAGLTAAYTLPLLAERLKKLPGWRDEVFQGRHALDWPVQVTGLHRIAEGVGASPDGLMGHVCQHPFFFRCLRNFSDSKKKSNAGSSRAQNASAD